MHSAQHHPDATVVLDDVTAGYGSGPDVLDAVSLAIEKPGVTRLSGENGAGKSTVIELISGYLRPRSGTVMVNGIAAHLPAARERRRICRSRVALHPAMTVADHLAFAAMSTGTSKDALVARAHEWHMAAWLDHRTSALSTGNARKIWTLLCTAGEFDLVVLDEPYDGLDAESRTTLSRWMTEWATHASVAVVAHGRVDDLTFDHEVQLGRGHDTHG